jgi:anti-sigma-K factor RskA
VTCEEFLELADGYVLGALDAEERAECERHLAEPAHRGCEAAVDRARATVAALAASLPAARPGGAVWRAIEARAGFEVRPRRAAWLGWAAAAAAALFLVLWQGSRREAERQLEAALGARQAQERERAALEAEVAALRLAGVPPRQLAALLDEPGSRVVRLAALPGRAGQATAVVNLAARRAVIVTSTLAPQPGKDWQLWVIRGTTAPIPAGFLRFTAPGVALAEIDPALLTAAPDAFAVSLEPAGGSPAPTEVHLVG